MVPCSFTQGFVLSNNTLFGNRMDGARHSYACTEAREQRVAAKKRQADRDLIVPAEKMPESIKKGMGERAREVERLRKANGLEP